MATIRKNHTTSRGCAKALIQFIVYCLVVLLLSDRASMTFFALGFSIKSPIASPTTTRSVCATRRTTISSSRFDKLQGARRDDDGDNDNEENSSSLDSNSQKNLPVWTVAVTTVLLAAIWPIIVASGSGNALNTGSSNPMTDNLDIDAFFTVKGLLDQASAIQTSGSGGSLATTPTQDITSYYGFGADPNTIMELPPLSPAERLVGAVFGPPSSSMALPPPPSMRNFPKP